MSRKKKEFAPGIPSKDKIEPIGDFSSPRIWDFAIQRHNAKRAGKHFDLRLGDPKTGSAHSWALRKLPKPGEKALAVQQPTHTREYMGFEGVIPKGYGAGKVERHALAKTEVLSASPEKVVFNVYEGSSSDEYALVKVKDDNWLLINRTPTEDSWTVPTSKAKYKDIKSPSKIDFANKDQIMSAKIDGAHVTVHLNPGKDVRVFSYRKSKRSGGVIEHTRRMTTLTGVKTPKGIGKAVLRGEIYARDKKTGKALPSTDVGAMLNSGVWKSRIKQKAKGKLRLALHDVESYRGKSMAAKGYDDKLDILKRVSKALPGVELPKMARTEKQKRKLFDAIESGKEKTTSEGVVLWDRKSGRPTKAKIVRDFDVYIKKVLKGKKKGDAGAYQYALSEDGPSVGKVGTGFSSAFRKDMLKDPSRYIGMVARVKAQSQYPSGALRTPSHMTLHLDKNEPGRLAAIKKLANEIGLTNDQQEA